MEYYFEIFIGTLVGSFLGLLLYDFLHRRR